MRSAEAAKVREKAGSPLRSRVAAALIPWAILAGELSLSFGNTLLQGAFGFLVVGCGVYMVGTYYLILAKRLGLRPTFAFRQPAEHQSLFVWWYFVPEPGAPRSETLVAAAFFVGVAAVILFLTADLVL